MTSPSRKVWIIVCADGTLHRDTPHSATLTTNSKQNALDAADYMDDLRGSTPWPCGPHRVEPHTGSDHDDPSASTSSGRS
jgi:hypothetical protein